ncbi:MAG: hypothetical protein LBI82_02990 [Dysgonamonadaceae bacterium]|jgi:hypothetical protein|nr:hypothetical protein [Dysgonamonadaceae bacterium]
MKWYYLILKLLKKHEVNNKYSPADFLNFLSEIKKVKINDEWLYAEVTQKTLKLLQKLEVVPIT